MIHELRRLPKLFDTASRLYKEGTQPRKLSWARVPVKMLGLGKIMIFSCDIRRYISNDHDYDKLSGNDD
jgi:hypothetical protein